MKKLFILLSLVAALGASEFMCKDSYSRYEKYFSLGGMALERGDTRKFKFSLERQLYYLEDVIAGCEEFYDIETLKVIRSATIQMLGSFDDL
jgi:hypothetical protein